MMVERPWEPADAQNAPLTPEPDAVARPQEKHDHTAQRPPSTKPENVTRAAVIWTFTVVAILVLIALVIFMMQNQVQATVTFLGMQGQMALGIAMLLAAVGGALVVAIVAAVRIIQLRSRAGAAAKRLRN